MPELPEVETVARDLAAQVVGRQIVAVEKLDWERMVETPAPADFRALLAGRTIHAVGRRAKWLLLTLDAGWTLALHLRMSGHLAVQPPEAAPDGYTHLVLAFDDGRRLFFHDQRKFGRARLLDAAGVAALDAAHGPEPLGNDFTVAVLAGILADRRTPIKVLLLDQQRIAGLGNIYVIEALWQASIHPLRPAHSLQDTEIATLHGAIQDVLQRAIINQGSTLRNYRTGYGSAGTNQDFFNAYKRTPREEKYCPRCGTPIARMVVAQRGTYYCPTCQRHNNGA